MSPAKKASKSAKGKSAAKAAKGKAKSAPKAAKPAAKRASKPALKSAPKASSPAAAAGHAHCAASDPFGDPCQNLPRRPSKYCVIHSYLER